jgi:hypothetical protein
VLNFRTCSIFEFWRSAGLHAAIFYLVEERFPTTVSPVRVLRLSDWLRTGDADVHESLGALLPVGTGGSRMLA